MCIPFAIPYVFVSPTEIPSLPAMLIFSDAPGPYGGGIPYGCVAIQIVQTTADGSYNCYM